MAACIENVLFYAKLCWKARLESAKKIAET